MPYIPDVYDLDFLAECKRELIICPELEWTWGYVFDIYDGEFMTIHDFAKSEQTRLEAEKTTRMREAGFKPFLKIGDMETVVLTLSQEEPRDNLKYPGRKVFRVTKEDKELDWSIAMNTPLYREVISNIVSGNMVLKVTRVGTSRDDTRYKVQKG